MLPSVQKLSAFLLLCVSQSVMTNPCFFWSGAQYFDKYCYKMVQISVNWTSALAMCSVDFGRLANPTTTGTRSFLTDMVTFSAAEANWWIGNYTTGAETGWGDDPYCLSITGTRNNANLPFYQSAPCGLNQSFICEKYVGSPCDQVNAGVVYFYAYCYTFSATTVHWDGERNPCGAGDLTELAGSEIYNFFKQSLLQLVEIEITTPLEEWLFPEDHGIYFDGVSGISFYVLTYGEARVILKTNQSYGSTSTENGNEGEAPTENPPWAMTNDVDITVTPKRRSFSVKRYENGTIACLTGAIASGQDQHCVQNISVSWSAQQGQPFVLRGGSAVPTSLVHINIDFPCDRMAIYTSNDTGIWFFPKFSNDVHVFLAAKDTDNNGVFRWTQSKLNVSRSDWLPDPVTAEDEEDRVHLTWMAGRQQHKTIGFRAVNGSITKAWPLCYQFGLRNWYYIAIPHGMSGTNKGSELVVSTGEEEMVYLYLVQRNIAPIQNWTTFERSAHFVHIFKAMLTPTYSGNTSVSEGHAAYLATTHHVTVVLYLRSAGGASSTLIYPSSYYKRSYFILIYWTLGLVNLITVTALYDNTEITIKIPNTLLLLDPYHFGFPLESKRFIMRCLGASQTIQLEAPQDMSGVYIYSSQSIAVFAGTRGLAGSYSNTLDMVLPVDVSSSRHVIQGSRPPPLSTDLSSLIAKLSQNSTSLLSGSLLVSQASSTTMSAGNGVTLPTTQGSTTTTLVYQTTSTSANLVLMKVLALYNATQITITSQDDRLATEVTMNQGDVLDIPLLTNKLYVMESDPVKPFQAVKVVLGLSGTCVTQILPNMTQPDRYDFEVEDEEQIVRVVTASNTSDLKDFNCDSATVDGWTYFSCSKPYSTGNYHLLFGNTTDVLEVYTQSSDAEFCHQLGLLASPPLTLPHFDPSAYSEKYQPDAPINTACLITTTTTQKATTTTPEVNTAITKKERSTHGATTTEQEVTTTPQEATATPQEATITSQEATTTSQEATTTSQENTTTTHGATFTTQGANTTTQGTNLTTQGATLTTKEPSSTPQGITSPTQGANSTTKGTTSYTQGATSTTQGPSYTTQGANWTTQGATWTTQGAISTTQGANSTTKGTTSNTQGATSTTQGTTSNTQGATSTTQGTTSTTQGTTSNTQGATSTTQGTTSITQGASSTTKGATSTTQGATSTTKSSTSTTQGATSTTHKVTSTTPEVTTTTQATTSKESTVSRVIISSLPTTSESTENYVIPNKTTLRNLKNGPSVCPCTCFKMSNNTDHPDDLILFGFSLRRQMGTKDGKMTAFSRRELSCHWDGRTSSQVIGLSGVAILICWGIFLFSLDILNVCGDMVVKEAQHSYHHNMSPTGRAS